jgi:hypothetical protein
MNFEKWSIMNFRSSSSVLGCLDVRFTPLRKIEHVRSFVLMYIQC